MQPDFQFLMLSNYESISCDGVQLYALTENQRSLFKLDTTTYSSCAVYPNEYVCITLKCWIILHVLMSTAQIMAF